MKVFAANYNPMIEESTYGYLSLHLSREGAEEVIRKHKESRLERWNKLYKDRGAKEPYEFGAFEDWVVDEIEILP